MLTMRSGAVKSAWLFLAAHFSGTMQAVHRTDGPPWGGFNPIAKKDHMGTGARRKLESEETRRGGAFRVQMVAVLMCSPAQQKFENRFGLALRMVFVPACNHVQAVARSIRDGEWDPFAGPLPDSAAHDLPSVPGPAGSALIATVAIFI